MNKVLQLKRYSKDVTTKFDLDTTIKRYRHAQAFLIGGLQEKALASTAAARK